MAAEKEKQPCRSIGSRLLRRWHWKRRRPLHGSPQKRVAIVGSPNVGKSLIFNRLTGMYVTVSNYPGTTVEVFRGCAVIEGVHYEIVDTPGMYSLLPGSEEERVARRLLLEERPDVVVHVVDAKNLERMLLLTIQLLEADLPVVLALNMMDEAHKAGLEIDIATLTEALQIPVLPVVAITGQGIAELRRVIHEVAHHGTLAAIRSESGRGYRADSAAAAG